MVVVGGSVVVGGGAGAVVVGAADVVAGAADAACCLGCCLLGTLILAFSHAFICVVVRVLWLAMACLHTVFAGVAALAGDPPNRKSVPAVTNTTMASPMPRLPTTGTSLREACFSAFIDPTSVVQVDHVIPAFHDVARSPQG